ncbi:MAG TPA: 23S rRNA (pseudouridine(1915)-N(3))-methyltransferase RlmH [Bacteroidia bacterium]|nr:23S rRNA (pseudouridine(1915)-N(3))-methyltransferase RlmH [Bacteroidia bacterium]
MKILLIQIDKTQDAYLDEGIAVYSKRLKNYTAFETITLSIPKSIRQKTIPEQKKEESRLLMQNLNKDDEVVLLDERGQAFSSEEFAAFLGKRQNASVKRLVFIIGGPFGFDDLMYKQARWKISLSRMTFSHQMVRLFFCEQLYRGFTILKGEKYHHS